MHNRRQMWNRWRLALALVISLGLLAARGHAQARFAAQAPTGGTATITLVQDRPPSPAVLFEAPDFTLSTLSGTSLSLAELRGKVVLLNFWATWCVPCRKEMPAIEALYQRYKDRGLEVLAISLDKGSTTVVEAFVKEVGVTYLVALDPSWATARTYGVRGLPATFLIDRAGNVVLRELGERDWMEEAKQQAVEGLLQEPGAAKRQ
jgi:peroxiredoxin